MNRPIQGPAGVVGIGDRSQDVAVGEIQWEFTEVPPPPRAQSIEEQEMAMQAQNPDTYIRDMFIEDMKDVCAKIGTNTGKLKKVVPEELPEASVDTQIRMSNKKRPTEKSIVDMSESTFGYANAMFSLFKVWNYSLDDMRAMFYGYSKKNTEIICGELYKMWYNKKQRVDEPSVLSLIDGVITMEYTEPEPVDNDYVMNKKIWTSDTLFKNTAWVYMGLPKEQKCEVMNLLEVHRLMFIGYGNVSDRYLAYSNELLRGLLDRLNRGEQQQWYLNKPNSKFLEYLEQTISARANGLAKLKNIKVHEVGVLVERDIGVLAKRALLPDVDGVPAIAKGVDHYTWAEFYNDFCRIFPQGDCKRAIEVLGLMCGQPLLLRQLLLEHGSLWLTKQMLLLNSRFSDQRWSWLVSTEAKLIVHEKGCPSLIFEPIDKEHWTEEKRSKHHYAAELTKDYTRLHGGQFLYCKYVGLMMLTLDELTVQRGRRSEWYDQNPHWQDDPDSVDNWFYFGEFDEETIERLYAEFAANRFIWDATIPVLLDGEDNVECFNPVNWFRKDLKPEYVEVLKGTELVDELGAYEVPKIYRTWNQGGLLPNDRNLVASNQDYQHVYAPRFASGHCAYMNEKHRVVEITAGLGGGDYVMHGCLRHNSVRYYGASVLGYKAEDYGNGWFMCLHNQSFIVVLPDAHWDGLKEFFKKGYCISVQPAVMDGVHTSAIVQFNNDWTSPCFGVMRSEASKTYAYDKSEVINAVKRVSGTFNTDAPRFGINKFYWPKGYMERLIERFNVALVQDLPDYETIPMFSSAVLRHEGLVCGRYTDPALNNSTKKMVFNICRGVRIKHDVYDGAKYKGYQWVLMKNNVKIDRTSKYDVVEMGAELKRRHLQYETWRIGTYEFNDSGVRSNNGVPVSVYSVWKYGGYKDSKIGINGQGLLSSERSATDKELTGCYHKHDDVKVYKRFE